MMTAQKLHHLRGITITDDLLEDYLLFDLCDVVDGKMIFTTQIDVDFSCSSLKQNRYFDDEIKTALSKLNEKYLEVLRLRVVNKMTLADTGIELGLTRERVRQIEEQSIRKLSALIAEEFLMTITQAIDDNEMLYTQDVPILDPKLRELTCHLISHKKFRRNFTYDKEFNAFIGSRDYTYLKIKSGLFDFMRSIDEALCSMDELKGYILYLYPRLNPERIIEKLFDENELIELDLNTVFLHHLFTTKRSKIEFVYSLYSDGFETTKNITELREQLNKFFPGTFINDADRAITALASFSEKIVLWEWGKHIYDKHILDVLNSYDFTDLLTYIEDELINVLAVDLDGFYRTHHSTLESFGIPSKYALHTLLKLKYPEDYAYQDSPRISSAGTERLDLSQVLLDVMTEKRSYSLEELIQLLNSPRDRVQQLIERMTEVISVDTHVYIKKEHVNLSNSLLSEIVIYLNEQVKQLNFLYIGLVVNKFRDQLHVIGDYNIETTLLELLRKCSFTKGFNVSNSRIVDKSHPITRSSLNFHYLLEQFMENKNEISKNELFEYFFIRGLGLKHIMNYYLFSKLKRVARISDETFVKLSSIGLDDTKVQTVTLLAERHCHVDLRIDDFIQMVHKELPEIFVEWNRFLISDILDKNIFKVIPSSENPQYIEIKSNPLS